MVKLKGITAIALALIIAVFTFSVSASDTRVFDNAGLLTGDEVSQLESYISELRGATGRDFVFLADTELAYDSDYDTAEATAVAHADDYYDYGGFGSDLNSRSGIIYYLDMTNRIPVIITTGDMIDIINDSRLSALFDTVYEYLGNEDYFNSAYQAFAQTKQYIDQGIVEGQYRYDSSTGEITSGYYRELTLTEAAIAVGAGLLVALIFYFGVKAKYSLKGRVYRYDLGINSECELTASSDDFLRETVTRTPRATSSGSGGGGRGSGTHTGSSGTSHGGGGGGHRF
jgi:uncharacterized protein